MNLDIKDQAINLENKFIFTNKMIKILYILNIFSKSLNFNRNLAKVDKIIVYKENK